VGALTGGRVVDLPEAVGHPVFPTSMETLISSQRGSVLDAARDAVERQDVGEFAVERPRLVAPLIPGSILDLEATRSPSGSPTSGDASDGPEQSIDRLAILDPDQSVVWPREANGVDLEVDVGCVIGSSGSRLDQREAEKTIFGFVLMTTWRAAAGARPARRGGRPGREAPALAWWEFATSLGPVLLTREESVTDPVTIRIDGAAVAELSPAPLLARLPMVVAELSRWQDLVPGDLCASGVRTGSIGRLCRLEPGVTVEVDADGLGRTHTTIEES
jgi:hypothetical protein